MARRVQDSGSGAVSAVEVQLVVRHGVDDLVEFRNAGRQLPGRQTDDGSDGTAKDASCAEWPQWGHLPAMWGRGSMMPGGGMVYIRSVCKILMVSRTEAPQYRVEASIGILKIN